MVVKGIKKQASILSGKWFLPVSVSIICITAITLYNRSVENDFLDLDDMTIIVRNYSFLKDFSNAGQAFKQGAFQIQGEKDTLTSYYRPVMILSFMLDAHISPKKTKYPIPAPFIEANIFYHLVACILLLLLLVELKIPPLSSLVLTLIFTVHPLINQAVAWIPGRNDSLLAIFILSSFIFLLRYLKHRKIWLLLVYIFFFIVALFTKENAIMLVPLIFLYLGFVNKEPILGKTYLILGIGYLISIILWFFMRQMALTTNAGRSTLADLAKTLVSNCPFYIQYISKSILPFNLSVMTTAVDTNYIVGLLAIGLLVAGILLSRKKNTALVLFGICWFLFFLSPSLFSAFSGLEHRAYLPLIGVFFIVSQFDFIKEADFNHKLGLIVLTAIFFLFVCLSFSRLSIFKNRYAFDQSAMETSPHSLLPCIYLATHYDQEAMYDKAINAYQEAMKRDSTYDLSYLNMAGDYLRINNHEEAEKILNLDIHRNPNNTVAVFNLGLIKFQYDHKDSEGVALWKRSISIDSGFAKPYKVLSQYYQATGDSSNAILYRNFYIKRGAR